MRRIILIIYFCSLGLGVWTTQPALSLEPMVMEIKPMNLTVDTFFAGGRIDIRGRIPALTDVVIEIIGPVVNTKCDVKGRVGPFWMTRQTVHLENVPGLYALLVPEGSEWEQQIQELGLGFDKLKTSLQVSPSELSEEEIQKMFVNLKKSEGLYSEEFGAVTYSTEHDGAKSFQSAYNFPSSTPTGAYLIKAIILKNGVTARELTREYLVREKGFVKLIDDLASNQRLLYGTLAVLIALLAGGLMGILFKGGRSH